jgi:hypothetical protein
VYDNEGRYIPQKFEDIFTKYAESGGNENDGITLREVFNLMKGQRLVFDIFGWGGAAFECRFTVFCLCPIDADMTRWLIGNVV